MIDLTRLHYLYVEDDPLSREVMELMINTYIGAPHLTMFEDSIDFMDRVRNMVPKPDIILLDIHLQPYTGFDMLEMLKADPDYADTPVIALTASVMNEEIKQLKAAGFTSTISKPLNMTEFPDLLTRIAAGGRVWHIG